MFLTPEGHVAAVTKPATVMGILNVTPDSFSDGGLYAAPEAAVARARQMMSEGADIIDVGGESTRPGAEVVGVDVELQRVIPVIEAVAPFAPVAVDTRHEEVARAAVAAGATVINDVSASMGPLAAELDVGWIAMHMQGDPASMQQAPHYVDVVAEVREYLLTRARQARNLGAKNVWIDPGFGFGKTMEHNLQLLAAIDGFVTGEFPVAVGTSRKSTLGKLLAASDGVDGPTAADDRLEGSVTSATFAMLHGVDLVRVHDVKATKQAAIVLAGANPS